MSNTKRIFVLAFTCMALLFGMWTTATMADEIDKPIRVQRYRDTVKGTHVFTTNPEASPLAFSKLTKETSSEMLESSPFFYVYTKQYLSTVPVYQFQNADGFMFFAANANERAEFISKGFIEVAKPIYLYDSKVEGASEVFRVENPVNGDIVYTTSLEEKSFYIKQGWTQLAHLGYTQSASSSGTGILKDTTVKLEPDDLAFVDQSSSKLGQEIVFRGENTKIAAIKIGTVLYTEKGELFPFGLILKVEAVTRTTPNKIVVETSPVDLYEAFVEFHLYLDNQPLYFLPPERDLKTISIVRSQIDPNGIETVADGTVVPEYLFDASVLSSITIAPLPNGADLSLDMAFSNNLYKNTPASLDIGGTMQLGATAELVYNGSTVNPTIIFLITPRETITVNLTATGQIAKKDELKILGPFPATFIVGGIPITAQVDLFAGYDVFGSMTAQLFASETLRMTAGVKHDPSVSFYNLAGICCPNPCPSGFTCGPGPTIPTGPTCLLSATAGGKLAVNASASVYLKPIIKLYAGAWGIGMGPYAYAKAELRAALELPNVNLYAQLVPGAGASITVAGVDGPKYDKEFDPAYIVKIASFPLAPTITSFKINNDAASTASRTVTLNNITAGSPTHYMASESSSFSGASWLTYATAPSFTLSSGNGTKTVYFKVRNATGESPVVSDTITLNEPLKPTITSFKINNDATSTTSRTVTLNNSTTNSPTQYMASESSSFSGASWLTYATAPSFTLSSGNGTKTVYFKVKNATGESPVVSDTISLNETGGVYGKLHINSVSGSPLSGATVICVGKSATTASDGSYTITGITPGNQTLSFSKLGYQPYSKSVTITSGQNFNAGDSYLTKK